MNYRWISLAFLLMCAVSHPALAQFEVKLNKGLAAYLKKDYQEAVKLLEEALVENPQSATANHILGLSLFRLAKYKESIPYLEKAKKLDPNIKGIHLDLGTAYLRIGDFRRALGEFEEAVRQEPESGLAYYNLGYTQFRRGDYKEAIAALDKASKLDPSLAPQSHFYAGLSHYKFKNYKEAKSNFELVQALGPETDLASPAQEYLDIIARLTKRYYGTVSSGVQYDTNVVLEPDEIEITNQADVSAIFFLNLGYKPYLKPDNAVIGGDYSAFFSFHKDLKDFNIQDHHINLYGEKKVCFRGTPIVYSLDYFYDLVLIEGSPAHHLFSQSHSVSPSVSVEEASYTSTELSYQFRYDNFKEFPERDAANNNWTIAQVLRLYDGRLLLKPGFNIALNSANNVEGELNFDYFAPQVFLQTLAFLPFGVTIFTNTYYFRQDYFNNQLGRVDNQIGTGVVVSKRLYKIFSLDFGYQHISNLSHIDVPEPNPFQYFRDIFSVTLTASF